MKKIMVVLLAIIMCIPFCSCGEKTPQEKPLQLTESQKERCAQVDDLLNYMADNTSNCQFSKTIEKIDGKIVYIATLNFDRGLSDDLAYLYADEIVPTMEAMLKGAFAEQDLSGENIYIVLYLNENGEETYRLLDSRLDPDFLD